MKALFVMDGLAGIKPATDTSLLIMEGAASRGWELWHCLAEELVFASGRLQARARCVALAERPWGSASPCRVLAERRLDVAAMDFIFIRKDPPFDAGYVAAMHLLSLVPRHVVQMNEPRGLLQVQEKQWALRYPHWLPATLLSTSLPELLDFQAGCGAVVCKPLDGHGGRGVTLCRTAPELELAWRMNGGAQGLPVLVQEYLEAVQQGADKRVLLLGARVLAVLARHPAQGDFRCNLACGGSVAPGTLSVEEEQLVAELAPQLLAMGVHFAGLDILAGRLLEVNVTSPTLARQAQDLCGIDCQTAICDYALELKNAMKDHP